VELAERRAALAQALEEFVVGADRVLEVHGLRLPKHLAYAIGWWRGMTDHERAGARYMFSLTDPVGVGAWLCEGHFDRAFTLARRAIDPPEMLSVFGTLDGRLALWYDDPTQLPGTIVCAREDDVIAVTAPTLLASLEVWEDGQNDPFEDMPELDAIMEWCEACVRLEKAAYKAEPIRPFAEREDVIDGVGPWIDGWTRPAELSGTYDAEAWIATARAKLATEPGWALVIGRELHSSDDEEQHAIGRELLVEAYRALGRDALAAIARR
jgi:hypothetical protein